MRRFLFIVLAAGLTGLGCNSTGKKPSPPSSATGNNNNKAAPFWSEDNSTAATPVKAPAQEVEGILAGMLIDSAGRPQANAVINVTAADAGPSGKPIGIQADDNGYFIVKGLKTGATYFVSARGDDRGKVIGGSTMTQAPNTRMLIKLSEGNVSSVTPPVQPPTAKKDPAAPEKKDSKTKLDPPASSIPTPDPVSIPKDPLTDGDQSWGPGKPPPTSKPLPPPPPKGNPNITDNNVRTSPPTVTIPWNSPKVEPPPPPASPSMSAVPANSSPLSEVQPIANQRVSFTLADFRGNPVEFSELTNRRLIVLDFWSTTCMPCLRKIPDLVDLQARYGNYVEVVGIACDNLPWDQRTKAVAGIKEYYVQRTPKPINYSIFFEPEGQESRVQNLYKIKAYPTMILVDHAGRELWRGSDSRQLEDSIKYYLMRK